MTELGERRGAPSRCGGAPTALLCAALAGCGQAGDEPGANAAADYIGGAVCTECHAEQAALWQGSHHALAMQPASDATVRGDFDGATLAVGGSEWRLYRQGDQFRAATFDADGAPRELTITHTFGVEPLQQYLVPQPGGRLQALGVAWDSRPAEAGGQRWFHLYPEAAADPQHPLHWTGAAQNWNAGCAYCHSTRLRKGYDAARDVFATTWASVNVDCEACHGPGSRHAADPSVPLVLGAVPGRQWLATGAPTAALVRGDAEHRDIELAVCAQCHARRSELSEDFRPGAALLDHFRPSLLTADLYHADGQILDEVFEYGSFVQSRMFAAGVLCTDCHEPHGARLRRDGNALCSGCHAAEVFDAARHHRHVPGAPGSQCVDCHMPGATYMMVDHRRDHSFRIPRPALAAATGSSDACAACHDRGADWAAATIAVWFPGGRSSAPHYGEALHAGRTWAADRLGRLAALAAEVSAPAIARATAVGLLAAEGDAVGLDAVTPFLRDAEPLVQLEALAALASAPLATRAALGQRFLDHPLHAVRIEAARVLAAARGELSAARRADLDAAVAEYFAVEELRRHDAAGLYNIALLRAELGDQVSAAAHLEQAVERDPRFAPAYVSLAELARRRGDDAAGERALRAGLERAPNDPSLRYALGLNLVRTGRREEARAELAAAATLAPAEPSYGYAAALAVAATDGDEAVARLTELAARFPGYRPAWLALAALHRDAGRIEQARAAVERILAAAPADAAARALRAELDRNR